MNDERRPVVVSSADARSAAAGVLERVAPLVRRALIARYGEAGSEAAADVVAWGWEHGDVLCEMANPGGYLYRVGQTAARRSRRRVVRLAFPVEPVWQDAPNLPGDVFGLLFRLRADQRVAVLLVHGYQFSYRDTAAVMGVSEDSVRNHVHRGNAEAASRTRGSNRRRVAFVIDLEERLRRAAQLLDQHNAVHEQPLVDGRTVARNGRRSSSLARVAAAAVMVLGGIGLVSLTLRSDTTGNGSEPTTATTAPPAETAPATSMPTPSSLATDVEGAAPPVYEPSGTLPPVTGATGSPVTVAGNEPTERYRLQPDLEVRGTAERVTRWCASGRRRSRSARPTASPQWTSAEDPLRSPAVPVSS